MKLLTIFSINILLLSAIKVFAQGAIIDGVVWIVGDQAILKSEVEEQRVRAQYEGVRFTGDPYCTIPEQIAVQKLFLHQAKIDSIVVSEGQIETQMNMRINYLLSEIGSKEKMEEYFRKPLSEIKNDLRETIRNQSLMQQMQQKIIGDIKVTPTEVRNFYAKMPTDSIPMMPASVEVEIITLNPEISQTEREATKEQLRDMAERVNKGTTDFSILARLYSEDTETAKQGGDLGFFGRGVMVPEFTNAAFALVEPGKVSRVVETEFGYHIIQLVEKRGDRVHCRHILMRPHVSAEAKAAAIARLDSFVTVIRGEKITFEAVAAKFSEDKNTRLNGGLMANANTGATRFELQDLPQEVAKVVNSMNIGEVSAPFSMIDKQLGREVLAIVKLKSKLPSHKANLIDDYQQIKQYCEVSHSNEVINAWIEKKIGETYIYIDPEWRNCRFEHDWLKENRKEDLP